MIRVCRDFGVETVRVDGRSGVWVLADDRGPDRKLGAIGVRVSRRVTMHGFALNCDADLSWADAIIPCGIAGCRCVVADRRGRSAGHRAGRAALRREAPHRRPGLSRHAIRGTSHARRRLSRVTVAPEGRRMLRVEARNAETPIERKPEWIRTTAKMGPEFTQIHAMVKGEGLHTVCQEAGCPNIFECWEDREATFLIGGDTCTRRCDFCDIATGRPQPLDLDEPRRVAESVRSMGLRYSTVTGVARDDQPDGAAGLYAETIRQIHALNPQHRRRDPPARLRRRARARRPGLRRPPRGVRAQPRDRAAHLQADPPRLHLRQVAARAHHGARGRAGHEVQPHPRHGRGGPRDRGGDPRPARRRAATSSRSPSTCGPPPSTTRSTAGSSPRSSCTGPTVAEDIGFKGVMAGPLVRSSYRAGRLWATAMNRWGRPIPEHLVAPRGGDGRPGPPGGGVVGGPRGAHRILITHARGIPRALPH